MPSWTSLQGNLADGIPMGLYLAEHAGQLWAASLHDQFHSRTEEDFLQSLGGDPRAWDRLEPTGSTLLEAAEMQVLDYFAGRQLTFDLPLRLRGTAFQIRVWNQLQRIPFGVTITYKQLAENIAQPQAIRAVGGANGKNNLPLIVPCHRVVASNGGLGGFTGGIGLKKRLLAHEAAVLQKRSAAA